MADTRDKYNAHIVAMVSAAGVADAAKKAPAIFALEKRSAQAHAPRIDTEDVQKGNNHWKRGEFAKRAPGLDWSAFFAGAGLDKADTFVVWQPKAFVATSALVKSVPLATWKDYLTYHALEHMADVLPKRFVDEAFAFHGKVINGTPKLRDRWKRAVSETNRALGMAVGKLYVEKYFPPSPRRASRRWSRTSWRRSRCASTS